MISAAELPKRFWTEAINTACYTQNRSMIHKQHNKTPYELWKGRKPNLNYFHSFGCKCFVLNNGKSYLKTFDERADEGIFLGYSSTSKAFRILNKKSMVVEESIHVVFDESRETSSMKNSSEGNKNQNEPNITNDIVGNDILQEIGDMEIKILENERGHSTVEIGVNAETQVQACTGEQPENPTSPNNLQPDLRWVKIILKT